MNPLLEQLRRRYGIFLDAENLKCLFRPVQLLGANIPRPAAGMAEPLSFRQVPFTALQGFLGELTILDVGRGSEPLDNLGAFVAQHIYLPREGAAVHINAFNFPVWGMLEKLAPAILAGVTFVILLAPMLHRRWQRNATNAAAIEAIGPSIDAQSDLGQIVARLHSEPVSRVYVPELGPGFVLTFAGIPTTYAGQMLSLDSMLPVDRLDPTYCNIFNVGYVITRSFGPRPGSLTPLLETSKYVLYRTDAEGYAQFGALRWGNIDAADLSKAQDQLYAGNFEWLRDGEAAQGKFIRWNFPARTEPTGEAGPGGPGSCTIAAEKFSSQRVEVTVDCREDATLIIKQTFHPNWHVAIDNVERPDFMVSPSYLGVVVPAGHHEVRAEYRSSALKKVLLVVGALALIAILLLRRRLDAIDTLLG